MLLDLHATGAGHVSSVSDSAHGVVRLLACAACARLRQYVAFQRLRLNRAASHRMVVSICR
ncbi:hypothetical protein ASF73_06235 [Xanthomonas sp. Leaf131]|nr:hypothetical protein ASF73_06235 [Xanthomonas sp. Leaf131]